jgi:membrane associated rhomboid family serine protease
MVLQLADHGVIATERLRLIFYTWGGFWPGLLDDWSPNFAAQPYVMFLTYSILHGGFWHLAFNMITLISVGSAVQERCGTRRYAAIYVASILGGGIGFGLLAPTLQPMVGASGAIFGLLGAIVALDTIERRALRQSMRPVVRLVVILIALNAGLWWVMDGQLAWETHLGGFVAGAVCAAVVGECDPAD